MDSEERPAKMRKLGNTEEVNPTQAPTHSEANPVPQPAQTEETIVKMEESHQENTENPPTQAPEVPLPNPTTIAPMLSSTPATSTDPPLSKSQQKKLKRRAEWDAKKDSRKLYRKEKQVARRERVRAAKAANPTDPTLPRPNPPRAVQLPITILIDCNFDDLMHEGERTSLSSQITRCYSDNKNSGFRAHLAVASFNGKLRERFDTVMERNYERWKGVRTFTEGFVDVAGKAEEWMAAEQGGKLAGVFSKYADLDDDAKEGLKTQGEVVYLSSEAGEDLTELMPYSTYIIGGLVDKNREKGICFKRARAAGVRTARLPIGEFMEMQSRKVLATNHVNEIMMKWLECGDWGKAFVKAIPKRKGGRLKWEGGDEKEGRKDGEGDGEGDGDGDDDEGGDESLDEEAGEAESSAAGQGNVEDPEKPQEGIDISMEPQVMAETPTGTQAAEGAAEQSQGGVPQP